MESDYNNSNSNYSASYSVTGGVASLLNTGNYLALENDAVSYGPTNYKTAFPAAGPTRNITRGTSDTYPIDISDNGTPNGTTGWTTAPTAYAIYGHTSTPGGFCMDSAGNSVTYAGNPAQTIPYPSTCPTQANW
jgi:hypothetical protein